MNNTPHPMICIIGAGPYGVSIAASLQFVGINFRIFGSPMRRWLSQMPERMLLRSENCASSLYDPTGLHTLPRYCKDEGIPYPEYGRPVPRELFVKYALSFQRTLVPKVEDVTVAAVSKTRDGFELGLSSGETLAAGKIIVATGLDYMAYTPEQLTELPPELGSHSADHYDLSGFKGKDVTVIGGGQSALETAALLHEEGALVRVLVRKPALTWYGDWPPSGVHRSWYERLRKPRTRLGDGLGHWVYDNFPGLFHYLPQGIRIVRVKSALGPAGVGWLKERVVGRLPILFGHHVWKAEGRGGRAVLQIVDQNERKRELITDHVIAATGYKFNFHNLPFLGEGLKLQLLHEQQWPRLSDNFESSIPGLYFSGFGSAASFGPVLRFIAGVDFAARRISSQLARVQRLPPRSFAQPEKCLEL